MSQATVTQPSGPQPEPRPQSAAGRAAAAGPAATAGAEPLGTLDDIVLALCAGYHDESLPLNHLCDTPLPSREITLQVLEDLKDVLFPDHRLKRAVRGGQISYVIGGLIEKVHETLREQILLACTFDYTGQGGTCVTADDADALTLAFLARLPDLRRALAEDVVAALDGDPAARSFDEIIFCYPGYEAVVAYRIAHELYRLGVPLLPRIITEHAHSRTGCDIHPGATIGGRFFIDHATGVVIGQTTLIGENVKLYQGVTLGALSFPKDEQGRLLRDTKRHPTIEDDVVIYAGATVLGGDTIIGAGAVIGGSCWITRSVPAGTKVMLQEPQMRVKAPEKERDVQPWVPDWCI